MKRAILLAAALLLAALALPALAQPAPDLVFSPKNLKGRAPMLVFAHGGVHGRLTSD